MSTITARVFEEDLQRAKVLGAVQHRSPQEIIHAALDEYVANHRRELAGLFSDVQRAVLDGDREALRATLAANAAARGVAAAERAAQEWDEG